MLSTLAMTVGLIALYFCVGIIALSAVDPKGDLLKWYDSIPEYAPTAMRQYWMHTAFWLAWPLIVLAYMVRSRR
jgi:hypothetical protein